MKIDRVFFQGKYSIHSQFLDTTLQAEAILEGEETVEYAMQKLKERVDAIAEAFRSVPSNSPYPYAPEINSVIETPPPPKEINLADEKTEITIDNATTLEELEPLKVKCHTVPMFKKYQEKLNQLKKQ